MAIRLMRPRLALAYETSKSGRASTGAMQLESRIKGLQAELEKLQLSRQQYQIIAPVSGQVITRDSVIKQLISKPVTRGEAILEIVPENTQWQLAVNILESDAGELLRAYDQRDGKALSAKVILNAYPELKFDSQVSHISSRAYVLSSGEQKYRNVIEVWVDEPAQLRDLVEPRQGMEGKVAIACGRRHLFYIVTHEFVNFLRVSLF